MRRKWIMAVAGFLVVAVAVPVALGADVQENTYTVSGSVSGAKGATKQHPKPVKLTFDYNVGEVHGWRPSVITKYSIFFGGGEVNNTAFPGCDLSKLNDPAGPGLSVCPKKSIMGKGQIINEVGPPSNVMSKALYCYLSLTTVNGTKKNQFLLWLEGGPQASSNPKKNCVQQTAQAIDAKFVKKSGGTALNFSVPSNLLHPAAGALDNAVTNVTSTINKVTTKKNGKTIGFFDAYQCLKKNTISVAFTQESNGKTTTAKTTYPCK